MRQHQFRQQSWTFQLNFLLTLWKLHADALNVHLRCRRYRHTIFMTSSEYVFRVQFMVTFVCHLDSEPICVCYLRRDIEIKRKKKHSFLNRFLLAVSRTHSIIVAHSWHSTTPSSSLAVVENPSWWDHEMMIEKITTLVACVFFYFYCLRSLADFNFSIMFAFCALLRQEVSLTSSQIRLLFFMSLLLATLCKLQL